MRMFEACGLDVLLSCNDAPSDVIRGRRVVSASPTPDDRLHSMLATVSSPRGKLVFSRYLYSRRVGLLLSFVRDHRLFQTLLSSSASSPKSRARRRPVAARGLT